MHRLGAQRDRPLIGLGRVGDAKRDRAHRRAVQPGKGLRETFGFRIQDEVGVALLVEGHVFRAVARRGDKPHALEQCRQRLRVGAGVFDKLKPVRPHRVVPQIAPLRPRRHRNLRALFGVGYGAATRHCERPATSCSRWNGLRRSQTPAGGRAPPPGSDQWLASMSQGVLPSGSGGMRSRSAIGSPAA